MSLIGIFILFFLGSSNAFPEHVSVDRDTGWLRFISSTGILFAILPGEELIVYDRLGGKGSQRLDYCRVFDSATKECKKIRIPHEGGLEYFVTVDFTKLSPMGITPANDWIIKYDVVVMEPPSSAVLPYDVTVFNFPAFCYYFNNQDSLKVIIHVDNIDTFELYRNPFDAFFADPEDKCKNYRPKVVDHTNFLNLNVFANSQWAKYGYYFIKKDKYICAYAFNFGDWLSGSSAYIKETKPVSFSLIDNYPTQHYAPNFFCIDAMYGTFVSLYWNQQKSNSLPEAHYYIINEKDIKNIQLIDRIILKDFDADVLKDIFENNFDSKQFPTFTSHGRQIFIWFKRPSDTRGFNGYWKSVDEYEVFFQYHSDYDFRKVFRGTKKWTQVERPVGVYDVSTTPKPITVPQVQEVQRPGPTQPQPATHAPTTPAPLTNAPSTLAPLTPAPATPAPLTPAPATPAPLTPAPNAPSTNSPSNNSLSTDSPSVNTSNYNISNNDTDSVQSTPKPAPLIATSPSDSNKDCSFLEDNLWWLFILLIIIDILEVIILVILIFLKFRGAKKMKAAMAKKKSSKSLKSKTPKSVTKIKGKKPKKSKKEPTKKKEKKKSIKEKSITQFTEDVGKSATVETKKMTTTVDQTNYFTVNETFDHSVLKNPAK